MDVGFRDYYVFLPLKTNKCYYAITFHQIHPKRAALHRGNITSSHGERIAVDWYG
jgi:hypothetical protein